MDKEQLDKLVQASSADEVAGVFLDNMILLAEQGHMNPDLMFNAFQASFELVAGGTAPRQAAACC